MEYWNMNTFLSLLFSVHNKKTQQNYLLTCLNITAIQRISVTFNHVIIQETLAWRSSKWSLVFHFLFPSVSAAFVMDTGYR